MRARRPTPHVRSLVVGAAVAALGFGALVACTEQTSEGGFGLPTLNDVARQSVLAATGADVQDLTGTMVVETNGCFTFRGPDPGAGEMSSAWIVWPETAEQDADIVRLASGHHVGQGSRLDVSGAFVTLDDLPEGADPDSYFGSFGAFCDAADRGVLVLVEITD